MRLSSMFKVQLYKLAETLNLECLISNNLTHIQYFFGSSPSVNFPTLFPVVLRIVPMRDSYKVL